MSNENLLKVEQIVPQIYGPCDPEVKNFCEEVQNYYINNYDKFNELFQCLLNTKVMHFRFWIMQTLIQLISQKYNNMANETKNNFRQFLLQMFNLDFDKLFKEYYIMQRYCLLFNKFIFYDFPENNNSIFNDILNNLYNCNDINQKLNKINLLIQIFFTFDEEFIKYPHTYSQIQISRSNKIKDFMRNNTIPNLLKVIKEILENEENIPNNKIIQNSIILVSQLIDWNPFEFFYDVLNIILGILIKKFKYFSQCCDVLYMIVKKGMEPKIKRNILNTININVLINNILKNERKIAETTLSRISDIIDLIGNFIIENFEYTKGLIKNNNNSVNDEIKESFDWSCNELRYYFYFLKEIITYNNNLNYKETLLILCKSLDIIVLYFKSNDIILNRNNYVLDSFKETFPILEKTLKIPENEYDFDEDLNELKIDDDFFKLRNELSLIYKNIYNIMILKEYVMDSIINNLITLLKINDKQNMNSIDINNINKYDVEFCLFLINLLQEATIGNILKNNPNLQKKFDQIIKILFSYPFYNLKNADFILLSYYSTLNNSIEFIIKESKTIEYIIKLYISEQGVFYNGNDFYKIKIVKYFDNFLSKIKKNIGKNNIKPNFDLNSFAKTIKESIYKLISYIKNKKNIQILKNYILFFHSYGLIISFEKDKDIKISNYKEALKLFNDIITELNSNNSLDKEEICELILSCLIQFMQTVGMKIESAEIKKLFSEFCNIFIGNYCIKIINNKNNTLITKYINFLQSILCLLGVDSLKYIELFFNNNNWFNPNVVCDCLKLLQNSINMIKKNSKNMIKKTFNSFFQYISGFQFPKDNISDESKTIINIFIEFTKIFNNITSDICEVFFENNGIDNLNFLNLIKFILFNGSNFIEPIQRRSTIKGIKNLCKYFNKYKKTFENNKIFEDILNLILNGLFLIYSKNHKKEAIDISSSVEIAHCHLYLLDFGNIYINFLKKYLEQNQINEFINIIKNVDYKKLKPSENMLIAFDHITGKMLNSMK